MFCEDIWMNIIEKINTNEFIKLRVVSTDLLKVVQKYINYIVLISETLDFVLVNKNKLSFSITYEKLFGWGILCKCKTKNDRYISEKILRDDLIWPDTRTTVKIKGNNLVIKNHTRDISFVRVNVHYIQIPNSWPTVNIS
jgi:hypothetical protein